MKSLWDRVKDPIYLLNAKNQQLGLGDKVCDQSSVMVSRTLQSSVIFLGIGYYWLSSPVIDIVSCHCLVSCLRLSISK